VQNVREAWRLQQVVIAGRLAATQRWRLPAPVGGRLQSASYECDSCYLYRIAVSGEAVAAEPTQAPEPATLALLFMGVLGLGSARSLTARGRRRSPAIITGMGEHGVINPLFNEATRHSRSIGTRILAA
jgi:hypothetical protein